MKPILLFTTLAILLSGCMFSQPDDAGRTVTISSGAITPVVSTGEVFVK